MAEQQPRRSAVEQVLALGYLSLVFAVVAALLPTALRPPPAQPPTSSELNPNAPPDEDQLLLSELDRARSATAGFGLDTGPARADAPEPARSAASQARGCPRGFGAPPRQTESLYSAPCLPAFTGDNGGATWKGVSGEEIRVALLLCTACPAGTLAPSYAGDVPTSPQPNETAQDRTLRVYQAYFNQSYQLYGRRLRVTVVKVNANNDNQMRAGVQDADERYKVFGLTGSGNDAAYQEAARRGLIAFGGYNAPSSFYNGPGRRPYIWGFNIDQSKLLKLVAEYTCKKLVGKRAVFAGDPTMQGQTRTFGLLTFENSGEAVGRGAEFRRLFDEQCRGEIAAESTSALSTDGNQSAFGAAVARYRTNGVTTVVNISDFITTAQITQASDAQAWLPEWIIGATNALEQAGNSRTYSPNQWSHAFGVSALEIPRPQGELDWYRAYKEVDPEGEPHAGVATNVFPMLTQFANGIQMAGPTLTPESFELGLFRMGRRPPDPLWSVAGGYAPGDYTYADYIAEIWWDPDATDPDANVGAYRYVRNGQRYTTGEVPREDTLVFRDGVTTPE